MKRVGGLIIFVVTFTAALLQLSDAADVGNAPEQRTEGELLKSLETFCLKASVRTRTDHLGTLG